MGGEGFLALSTDLVEIYNANTGQLKFTSSSPITIVRADVYEHKRNGEIVKRQKINDVDPVDAYYVNKFGVLTQLPTDESNPESVILANTSAVVDGEDSEVLNGSITINSPFIGDATATEDLLKNDSHDNTIRYLEFLVTNEDDLSATFRVMQYPPVVITNQEGYFSYREDMRIADLPHYYYQDQFRFPFGQNMPIDNGEATHYKNPIAPFFCVAGFFKYNEIEWNNETNRVIKQDSKVLYEEGLYGLMERDYHRVDAYKNNGISGVYHRTHVLWENGKAYPDDSSSNYDDTGDYYQNVGPVYLKEETGKYYRRHYTGQSYNFFFSKFVGEVHEDGKATIHKQMPNVNGPDDPKPIWNQWASMGAYFNYHANHRMYHIRVTNTSINYTIGWPIMEVEDGRTYTAEGEKNSMTVSPSFMVASQLGEAIVPKSDQYYTVPAVEGMYEFAKRQCEQYAEAFYEDIDNDGYTPGTDPITHYSDWRLPTRAELGIINYYQQHSRAMDLVLTGDSYFCASVTPLVYSSNTVLYDRRTNTEGNLTNYHMRCVRDVKPGQKLLKKIYPI